MPNDRPFTLEPVSKSQMPLLAELARSIWEEWFTPLLGKAQVAYMVDKFQSLPAMTHQVEKEGYEYYFLTDGGEVCGYMGIHPDPKDGLFLSKLYLRKSARGQGFARKAFEALCERAKRDGLPRIHLTVNKHNLQAIRVYEHLGLVRYGDTVTDIGSGFVMDDYLYEYKF